MTTTATDSSHEIVVLLSVLAIAFTFVMMVLSVALLYFLRDRSERKYDEFKRRAYLSDMRENIEGEIAHLNAELAATQKRWKDANHLLLDAQNHQPEKIGSANVSTTRFLRSFGITRPTEVDPKLVLVLTPFRTDEEVEYTIVKSVCDEIGFRCVRGDEEQAVGEILPHIVKLIISARVIIANVTSRNPNVFYELGVAQALGKPTILISRQISGIPFDIQSKRVLLHSSASELRDKLRTAMLRAVVQLEGEE